MVVKLTKLLNNDIQTLAIDFKQGKWAGCQILSSINYDLAGDVAGDVVTDCSASQSDT